MRIVHVVQCLGMGGQERLILSLSRALSARGHDVSVLSLTPGGELRAEFAPAVRVLDATRHAGFDPLLPLNIARTFMAARPDVVHTHNPSPMFYGATAARAALVRRVVHTKHGANIYGPRSLLAARVLVHGLSAFVAVSEGTADVARKKERVPERILRVIPNGIPLGDFHPDAAARALVREGLGIAPDAFVVGSVGRLAEEKDYPLLVRAMLPLLSDKMRLVLVGDGAARPDILAAIPKDKAPFVTLTGSRRDVPALFAAFDVFALSSRTEGLPLVIPEAMASGLPVVATAVGGLPSIVPEAVGKLVPYGDAPALGNALEAYALSSELRAGASTAAIRFANEHFSLEKMTDAYEALYRGDRSS